MEIINNISTVYIDNSMHIRRTTKFQLNRGSILSITCTRDVLQEVQVVPVLLKIPLLLVDPKDTLKWITNKSKTHGVSGESCWSWVTILTLKEQNKHQKNNTIELAYRWSITTWVTRVTRRASQTLQY